LLMQDERSKIMNSSAFSCGDKAVRAAQQPGKAVRVTGGVAVVATGSPGNPVDAESLTCNPVYTKRPHWLPAAVPIGVLKLK
jgi:hypothetical protein